MARRRAGTIDRRTFLTGMAAGPVLAAACGGASGKRASGRSPGRRAPNIVVVLTDDLGWGDLGCYNSDSQVPTPHCDRLAREGLRLLQMHSPSAVCTPTRYGLLTGRYCWRTRLTKGVVDGYAPALIEPGRETIASLLRARGYRTAAIGKWHLGLGSAQPVDYGQPLRPGPLDHGFDQFFGIPVSLDMEPYVYIEGDRVVAPPTERTPGKGSDHALGGADGVYWRPGPMAAGFAHAEVMPALARRAQRFVREAAGAGQPFFLYYPMTGPHTPWLPAAEYRGTSGAGDYGDFVAQVDGAIGELLATVEEVGVAGETLFIVTSDNGADWNPENARAFPRHRANGPLRGRKRDIHEAGHRVPFIARWPGVVPAGATSDRLACLVDLFATAAEIVGTAVAADAGEDSVSLLPVLRGERATRSPVVLHSQAGMFAIRDQEWKLVEGLGSGGVSEPAWVTPKPGEPAGQLYHLAVDPGETRDLYRERPEVVTRLAALLDRYRATGRSTARRA